MLRVEVAIRDGSAEGVQDEEQRNQVQSGVQVPDGVGGPEGQGVRGRGPSGPGLRGAPACIGQWKKRMKGRFEKGLRRWSGTWSIRTHKWPLRILGTLLTRNTLLPLIGQAVPLVVGVVTSPFIMWSWGGALW